MFASGNPMASSPSSYPDAFPDMSYSAPASQQLCYNVPLKKPSAASDVMADASDVAPLASRHDYCRIRDKSTAKTYYLANSDGDIATCNTVPPLPEELPSKVNAVCEFELSGESTFVPC